MDQGQTEALGSAYQSIVRGEKKWLLLGYTDGMNIHSLTLCAQGNKGLEELKSFFRVNEVQHAVYREDLSSTMALVMITYTPTSVSGVEKTRALANARRLTAILQGCRTLLTMDRLQGLTNETVHQAVAEQCHTIHMQRSSSESAQLISRRLPDFHASEKIKRASSETNGSYIDDKMRNISQRSQKIFSSVLGRKKGLQAPDIRAEPEAPPAPPPKDNMKIQQSDITWRGAAELERRFSDAGLPSPTPEEGQSIVPVPHPDMPLELRSTHVPLQEKWAVSVMLDPTERARRRLQARLDRQREEQEAEEEEARRQAAIRKRKEEMRKQELEDQARRMALLEEDLKRAAAKRQRREHLEMVEEEQTQRFFELRKRVEKEKRLELHRRMEQWRREHLEREEEARRRSEETERKQKERRLQGISQAQERLQRQEGPIEGWVTIQMSGSMIWKRRVFKLNGGKISLYPDEKVREGRTTNILPFDKALQNLNHPVIEVRIKNHVRSIREWDEGYEELKAIPHSFVIEFVQRGEIWMMYTDSEEEKYTILGYMYHFATPTP